MLMFRYYIRVCLIESGVHFCLLQLLSQLFDPQFIVAQEDSLGFPFVCVLLASFLIFFLDWLLRVCALAGASCFYELPIA